MSILLAFGIDAWWQDRGDQSAEREALVGLHAEFTGIRERLEEDAFFGPELAAVEDLYERAQALPVDGGTLSVSDTALALVVGAVTFEGETPVLDGLISSGRLEVIRDQRIRLAISEWQHWLTQLDELEQESKTFTNLQLRPALVSSGDVAAAFSSARSFGYVELDPSGVTTLRIDSELRALLGGRLGYAGGMMEVRQRLAAFSNNLLTAIGNLQER